MDLGLKGLKAILAGASKGIGRATADVLASEGCDVAICARGKDALTSSLEALRSTGVKATGESVDLTDADSYRAWVKAAAEELGGCDIFICFASAGGGPPSEKTWKAAFDLDLLATYRGVDAALPFLQKSRAGSIGVVSSTAALEEFFGPQPYNALKAAVINYASALSQQLAPKAIRVNTISPGPIFIEGGSWDNIKRHMTPLYDRTLKTIPMGRYGTAEEVARAISFVVSPACGFMT